jgi:hypothetical protein
MSTRLHVYFACACVTTCALTGDHDNVEQPILTLNPKP